MLPFCVLIIEIFFDYKSYTVYNFIVNVSIIGLIYIRFPNFLVTTNDILSSSSLLCHLYLKHMWCLVWSQHLGKIWPVVVEILTITISLDGWLAWWLGGWFLVNIIQLRGPSCKLRLSRFSDKLKFHIVSFLIMVITIFHF